MTDTPQRPARLDRREIVSLGFLAIGPHIEKLYSYIDYLESQQFYYDGPLPAGYEIHVVVASTEEPVKTERPRTPTKARAQTIDKTWTGPWRKSNQGGLIVGDAWKHVTKAKEVNIDEAGGG